MTRSENVPVKRQRSVLAHAYAMILAGGSGTRFWPLSRRRRPKQLLELFGRGTLLAQTVDRIRPLIPPERTYVLTNQLIWRDVVRSLPGVPKGQIIAEPAARNTAPAIGLAAHELARRDPDGIMVVLPSDHLITKPAAFRRVLRAGCRFAAVEGRTVVVGLKPSRPDTGYGYVEVGSPAGSVAAGPAVLNVLAFKEKPDAELAATYLASGDYLWNGGMFIWRASTLLRHLAEFQPEMARVLDRIARAGGVRSPKVLKSLYPKIEKISVDYALMEKIPDIYAAAADIGWSDVGSWEVAYQLSRKDADANVRPQRSLTLNSRGNMIVSSGKCVVTVGVNDLVIVETVDALLVCARDRSQEVGRAIDQLEKSGQRDLL